MLCRIVSAAALAVFLATTIIAGTQRNLVFADELINTAKTFTGFSSSWTGNVLDYSLRPVYRLLNVAWAALFGVSMTSLWLGTVLSAIVIGGILHRLGACVAGPLVAASAPLFLLSSPLYIPVGLAAMPHLPSGMFTIGSLIFLLAWQSARPDSVAANRATWFASAAFIFAVLAFLTHPSQLAFVVALFVAVGAVVIVGFIRDNLSPGVHTWKALIPASAGVVTFFVAIGLVETTYRWLAGDATHERLLPGYTYSFVNMWVSTLYEFDKSLASYAKPASFYITYLFVQQPAFTLVTLGIVISAVTVLIVRWRNGEFVERDLFYFIPALLVFVWIAVASLAKMKFDRVLVGVTPLAVANNTLLIGYLLSFVAPRFRPAIGVFIVVLAAGWAASAVSSQHLYLQSLTAKKYKRIGALYNIFHGLPEGNVGFIEVGTNVNKARRYCKYFANATGRLMHEIGPTREEMRKVRYRKRHGSGALFMRLGRKLQSLELRVNEALD
jgi:hypothetical protein